MNKKPALLVLFSLLLTIPAFAAYSYTDVTVLEAKAMIDSDPSIVVLDVRNQSEYDGGHIRNAKLIPHTELEGRLDELNPNDEILVYCKTGVRSSNASQILVDNGFMYVYNMLGGITAWINASYPVCVKYPSIQEAINNANEGDTLYVSSGTYYENIFVDKPVSLIGENKSTTIIDGNSIGHVMNIEAENVSVVDFTIRNAGKSWGGGFPDSCILASSVMNVSIKNNVATNGTVGILVYASSNVSVCNNFVGNCGLMGIHLDGNSVVCKIINNTVEDNLEGIELEQSATNLVEGNRLFHNNVSMVLNQCGGSNVFRRNNFSSDGYSLIVWGWSLEAFTQDIDKSNIANNKTIYYLTNCHNLTVNTSAYPNLGYLAIINCVNITVRNIDLSLNKDGLLLVESTNCSLINITLSGNLGPLLYGGLTFFESSNNHVVNSRIGNNSVAVCLYRSEGNVFYHNSFGNNEQQVISNYHSPFSAPSGPYSMNVWDNGFEGNYWSDYAGVDLTRDGIGDVWREIDANNADHFPLMGLFYSFNTSLGEHVDIISNSTIEDFEYFESNSTIRLVVSDGLEDDLTSLTNADADPNLSSEGFCRVCIPHILMDVNNISVIIDDGLTPILYHNYSLHDNGTHRWIYFSYQHSTHEIIIILEYPSLAILPLLMITTLFAVMVYRRFLHKTNKQCE